MENKKNELIEIWKAGAKMIAFAYEMHLENPKTKLMQLAREQMEMIANQKPNKELSAREQMNEEQKELIDYLGKVAETGELD